MDYFWAFFFPLFRLELAQLVGYIFVGLGLGSSLLPLWLPFLSWECSRCTVAFLILLPYFFLGIQSLNIQKKKKNSGLAIIHVRANNLMIKIAQSK